MKYFDSVEIILDIFILIFIIFNIYPSYRLAKVIDNFTSNFVLILLAIFSLFYCSIYTSIGIFIFVFFLIYRSSEVNGNYFNYSNKSNNYIYQKAKDIDREIDNNYNKYPTTLEENIINEMNTTYDKDTMVPIEIINDNSNNTNKYKPVQSSSSYGSTIE